MGEAFFQQYFFLYKLYLYVYRLTMIAVRSNTIVTCLRDIHQSVVIFIDTRVLALSNS